MKPAAGLLAVWFVCLFVWWFFFLFVCLLFGLFVCLFVCFLFVCEHVVTCQGVVSCEACGRFVLSRYFPDRLLASRLNAKLSASLFHFSALFFYSSWRQTFFFSLPFLFSSSFCFLLTLLLRWNIWNSVPREMRNDFFLHNAWKAGILFARSRAGNTSLPFHTQTILNIILGVNGFSQTFPFLSFSGYFWHRRLGSHFVLHI